MKTVEIIRILKSILEEPVIDLNDKEVQAMKEAIEIIKEKI